MAHWTAGETPEQRRQRGVLIWQRRWRNQAIQEAEHRIVESGLADWDTVRAAIVLLSMRRYGINSAGIAEATGYPVDEVSKMIAKLVENRVWFFGRLHVEWDDDERGAFAFILDTLTATGDIVRTTRPGVETLWKSVRQGSEIHVQG